MNKFLLTSIPFLFLNLALGQQQLQNPGFEEWEHEGTLKEEPVNWSSLKTADNHSDQAPEVLTRVSGRTGDYAVQLEVKEVFLIDANGIMTNGRVHAEFNPENGYVFTNANDPRWHTSFSDRPDSIVGWYKYNPQGNDQGKVEIILHTGPNARLPKDATTSANEIGNARYNFTTEKTEWTRFSTPFTYLSEEDPDYILTTIASGDSTIANEGTILQIDDLELIYNYLNTDSFEKEEIAIHAGAGYLNFDLKNNENVDYSIADVTGKIVQSGKAHPKTQFNHESGIYFIQVETAKRIYTKKLFYQH